MRVTQPLACSNVSFLYGETFELGEQQCVFLQVMAVVHQVADLKPFPGISCASALLGFSFLPSFTCSLTTSQPTLLVQAISWSRRAMPTRTGGSTTGSCFALRFFTA